MLGLLDMAGYRLVREPQGADFVIVNTCGFLGVAREESLETIREMVRHKLHVLGVAGKADAVTARWKELGSPQPAYYR